MYSPTYLKKEGKKLHCRLRSLKMILIPVSGTTKTLSGHPTNCVWLFVQNRGRLSKLPCLDYFRCRRNDSAPDSGFKLPKMLTWEDVVLKSDISAIEKETTHSCCWIQWFIYRVSLMVGILFMLLFWVFPCITTYVCCMIVEVSE